MHDQVPFRESGQPPREDRSIRRVMIITIIVVVLLAVSFAAGRFTKSGASASPARTVTMTAPPATVTVTPTASAPTPSSQPSSAPAPAGSAAPAGANGTQAGSYNVKLPGNYSTPLGVTPPKQSQFNTNGTGDISYNGNVLSTGSLDQLLYLAPATTPTYKICTADTVYVNNVTPGNRVAFCLKEPGYMLGMTVTFVSSSPSYVALRVWVWKNA